MFLWERLLLCNIPYENSDGGDGGDGDSGDTGDSTDNSSETDSGRDAAVGQIGGGPNATPGIGAGSLSEAAANIAGTSGGPEAAAANAAATGDAAISSAVADALGGMGGTALGGTSDVGSSSLAQAAASPNAAISTTSAAVAPATSAAPSAGVAPSTSIGVTDALGTTSVGGFGIGGVTGGVTGANVSGGLGGLGALGSSSGIAGLGDVGPQGFAASESGFAPSSNATDVSNAMGALGLGGTMADFAGDVNSIGSSLAAAAAGEETGLSDIGMADPSGMSTGFAGLGTGSTSLASAIGAIGQGNIGAYSGPTAQTAGALAPPAGTQAASVGVSPSIGVAGLTASQLSDQLSSMTQPSAQTTIGSATPSISSTGFSGMNVSGLSGLAGTQSVSAPAATSSIAAAAAGATPAAAAPSAAAAHSTSTATRSASSLAAEDEAPSMFSGVGSFFGNPAVSMAVNTGLSLASPHYGMANAVVAGLTGTSILGQGISLASGQGLQTGGGLMGLASGLGQSGLAPSIGGPGPAPSAPQSGGGGDIAPTIWTMSNEAKQGSEVLAQPSSRTPAPIQYNIADFIAPAPQQGYRPLVI